MSPAEPISEGNLTWAVSPCKRSPAHPCAARERFWRPRTSRTAVVSPESGFVHVTWVVDSPHCFYHAGGD